MKTAHDIITRIGKPRIRAAMGVSARTINQYAQEGKIPAAWFDFCEKATRRKLDRSLFTFKKVDADASR